AHQAGVVLGETPGFIPKPSEPKVTPSAAIPIATLNEIRGKLGALPPFYKNVLPYDDRGRAEALLVAGHGTSEDTTFLNGRFSDYLRKCESEQNAIGTRVRELEAKINDPAAL